VNKQSVSGQIASFEPEFPASMHVRVGADGLTSAVTVRELDVDGDRYHASLQITDASGAKELSEVQFSWRKDSLLLRATVDKVDYVLQLISHTSNSYTVQHIGTKFDVRVLNDREAELAALIPVKVKADQTRTLLSPMPGAVFSVKVNVGDAVCICLQRLGDLI
jgi:propionyl-CoA carboxylase alpha chain